MEFQTVDLLIVFYFMHLLSIVWNFRYSIFSLFLYLLLALFCFVSFTGDNGLNFIVLWDWHVLYLCNLYVMRMHRLKVYIMW
jgi:predicted membrane protein